MLGLALHAIATLNGAVLFCFLYEERNMHLDKHVLSDRRVFFVFLCLRPIAVKKSIDDVTSEEKKELCNEVQDSVVDIYERHRPFWEKRPIEFER